MIAKLVSSLFIILFHARHATGARYDAFTSANLHSYMKAALPGDEIILNPGTYTGNFYSFASGTASQKITIRSADPKNKAVLRGLNFAYGEALYIDGNHWIVQDLILANALHGIVFDNAMDGAIINCEVRDTGEEGIHIRDGSSNFLIQGNAIQNTGLSEPGYGEGIYVGSDRGVHTIFNSTVAFIIIQGNSIGPNIRAEAIDVKEGTHDVIIQNNTFNAAGLSGVNYADSFIDLKGIRSVVRYNTFNQNGAALLTRGINVIDRGVENSSHDHVILGNTFNLDTSTVLMVQANKDTANIHVQGNIRNPQAGTNYGGLVNQTGLPSWYFDVGAPTRCETPNVAILPDVTASSATVVWATIAGFNAYNLQYKQGTSTTWTSRAGLSGTSLILTSLLAGTIYDVQVQAVCSTTVSSRFSLSAQFQTKVASTPNPTPVPMHSPTPAPTTSRPVSQRPTFSPTLRPTSPRPTTLRPTSPRPTSPRPTTARPTTLRPTSPRPTTARPTWSLTPSPTLGTDTISSQIVFANGAFNRADWQDLSTNGYILYNYKDAASHPSTLNAKLKQFGTVHFKASGIAPTGFNRFRFSVRGITLGAIRIRVNSAYTDITMSQDWRDHSFEFSFVVGGSSATSIRFENIGPSPVNFLLDDLWFVV